MSEITFDTSYIGAWREQQNIEYRELIRDRLDRNIATIVVFQPGDGTRYRFLLAPEPRAFIISTEREPSDQHANANSLLVSVLDGLGNGVASISGDNDIDGIRYRIMDKLDIRNPCTAEALAATVLVLWSDHFDE